MTERHDHDDEDNKDEHAGRRDERRPGRQADEVRERASGPAPEWCIPTAPPPV